MTNRIVDLKAKLLVTGAGGFLGGKILETLLAYGFSDIRCIVRPSTKLDHVLSILASHPNANIEIVEGSLLSKTDCQEACSDVQIIFHSAAGSDKSFSGSFLNAAIPTRNLLEAVVGKSQFKRFVNVSSFAVYAPDRLNGALLDETCPVEADLVGRGESYCYGKLRQDELVIKFGKEHSVPYVIVRPGPIYGPRSRAPLHARIGLDTFGMFLHLGGSNRLGFTYVDNCADAIVLAGITAGVDSQVFNIIDDELPTSRQFLRIFKERAYGFRSVSVPYPIFYVLSWMWEKYAEKSRGQIPAAFNRRRCRIDYRQYKYSNRRAKDALGWAPKVGLTDALQRHCEYFREDERRHS